MRCCLVGCGWLEICGRVCGNFILKFVKGADGGGVDTEFPVRKETARKSRVMIGAWGKLFARFNLLLLCFSSHSLYPQTNFQAVPLLPGGMPCIALFELVSCAGLLSCPEDRDIGFGGRRSVW